MLCLLKVLSKLLLSVCLYISACACMCTCVCACVTSLPASYSTLLWTMTACVWLPGGLRRPYWWAGPWGQDWQDDEESDLFIQTYGHTHTLTCNLTCIRTSRHTHIQTYIHTHNTQSYLLSFTTLLNTLVLLGKTKPEGTMWYKDCVVDSKLTTSTWRLWKATSLSW